MAFDHDVHLVHRSTSLTEMSGWATPRHASPKDLFQSMLTAYVAIGCLAVYTWDILHSLAADYRLLFHRQFNLKTAVFFSSRLATFGWILSSCIQITALLDDCRPILSAICACFALARSLTAMLFYFRVTAVYRENYYVVGFFSFTWLAVAAAAVLTFAGGTPDREIMDPHNCNTPMKQKYLVASASAELINDTFVLIAILHRLSTDNDDEPNGRAGWRSLLGFRKTSMRKFTQSFIQDSQLCYLVAVCLNLATIITYFVADDPPTSPIRLMMVYPNTTVVNIMATKVYRNMRLGRSGLLPSERTTFRIGNLSFVREAENATNLSDSTDPASTPPSSPLDPPQVMPRLDIEAGFRIGEKDSRSMRTFDIKDEKSFHKDAV
ncbi:hypothetical protein CPB83DRAFT_860329 [Crepidotus variabilis]|uniref:Uncharacterized protein n=1 Tax=Crepidotus variabilis TaxID=179855 RepID=A0A9P6E9I3_9AGAR|nr:hypothetical protein CPB83DRAFT_860329 [Crepidotus variabilis]